MKEVDNKIKLKYLPVMVSNDYDNEKKDRQEVVLTDGRTRLQFNITW